MTVIFADSNRASIRYIRSSGGWAQTPASGLTRELRFTGSTINAQKDTTISEEIRADRMVPSVVQVGDKSTGDINGEFSAGTHDFLYEAFMFGAWSRPMTFDQVKGDSVEIGTTSKVYILGVDMSAYFIAGHRILLTGFANPNNNNVFQITSLTFNAGADRTEITISETVLTVEGGSVSTALYDANDVILMKSTALRFGTAGAQTIDSNGGNAFASAITAGQLVVGQNIWVETQLGMGVGTFTFSAIPTAGDTVTVSDGVNPAVTFTFAGGAGTNSVAIGVADTNTATNLAAAINAYRAANPGLLDVVATAATTVVTVTNLNTDGGALTAPINTGAVNTVVSFTGAVDGIRGMFTLTAVTEDVLTVAQAVPTNANSGSVPVTIKGSILQNPSNPADINPADYTIETQFNDVGQFFTTDGLKIGSFSIDVTANVITKVQFNLHGRKTTRSVTSTFNNTPYTPLATTATEVVNATVNVGDLTLDGHAFSTALQSVTVTGDNALRDQMAVGNQFPAGIGAGRMEIKGAVKAYFADGTLWDHFINHDTVSLSFYIQDLDTNHYIFTIPAAKFSTDTVNPAAGNQDVMEDMEYIAQRDPVTNCQIQIDRFSPLIVVGK